jgi:VanZ family protein
MTALLRYWLPVLVWMALILTLSGRSELAVGANPATGETVKPGLALAKLGHVFEYAVLAVLMFRAATAGDGGLRLPPRRAAVWIAVVALAFGTGDELRQSLVPNRSPRLTDVLLDGTSAGVTATILMVRQLRKTSCHPASSARRLPRPVP